MLVGEAGRGRCNQAAPQAALSVLDLHSTVPRRCFLTWF